jgi:dimethylargininase
MFTKAIVRVPGSNFANGLTTVDLGTPDLARTLAQHDSYCRTLAACGLTLTRLPTDENYPDSTFVEDTAVLTPNLAILTRPGALSREGEVQSMSLELPRHYSRIEMITAPGTLDGGDICEAGNHFFIGVSHRTNEEGARQLAGFLQSEGFTTSTVDIREIPSILHLKSGIAWLGSKQLATIEALAGRVEIRGWDTLTVPEGEEYAANCIRVNDHLLIAAGFPRFETMVRGQGHEVIALDMSEFRKMDGGLSCLSLRF